MTGAPRRGSEVLVGVATMMVIAVTVTMLALVVVVGADCYWLVALGRHIFEQGRIPIGVPFAVAPSDGWPNVLVLAELALAGLHAINPEALVVAQLALVALTMFILAAGAVQRGARDLPVATVLLLVALGSLQTLAVVRLQMLSLVPFALLLLLLRAEHSKPSVRVWLIVPLLIVWTNLHGAALVGLALTGCYLLFSRFQTAPKTAAAVGLISGVSLLVTPAGVSSASYYAGVLGNEAARRGSDLWARPSLESGFDLLLIGSAVILLICAVRARPAVWELVALAGLAVATATAARHGAWLLMTAATPAACYISMAARPGRSSALPAVERYLRPGTSAALIAVIGAVATLLVATRSQAVLPAPTPVLQALVARSEGRVVLAPEPMAESLAVAGVRIWAGDPLDAFSTADQTAYLDFLTNGPAARRALAQVDLATAPLASAADESIRASSMFVLAASVDDWRIYVRRH